MNRGDLVNGLVVILALALSIASAELRAPIADLAVDDARPESGAMRIVSASTVADQLLLALCERERVAAVTAISVEAAPDRHRYAGMPTVASLDDVEAIVAMSPEVVLTSNVADTRRVARLEEAGVRVIDLGVPSGFEALKRAIIEVAALCGDPARGERFTKTLELRVASIADGVTERRGALYAVVFGGRIYGGTVGTSYHDVIRFAGLRDVAAHAHRDFPQYTTEQLLRLDPEIIVTRDGMHQAICRQPGLESLRACAGSVVEIDAALLEDPGLGMIDAALLLRAATR
jgi:iron complex transport system substrate-binding protein